MRAPLDVPPLIHPILAERNPDPRSTDLFWKVAVSMGDCADRRVGRWLRGKLSRGAVSDDNLLSEYRIARQQLLPPQRHGYLYLCFRDSDNSTEAELQGTQGAVLLIDADDVKRYVKPLPRRVV